MPLPASPSSGPPTGNALTDASGLQADPAQAAAAVNTVNLQNAAVASDCLWPPSGQITVPIIPGLVHQSVQIPCLLTYGEARALVAVGLIVGGLLIAGWGVSLIVAGEVLPPVLAAVGARTGAGRAAAVTTNTTGSPSGTPPPPAPAQPAPSPPQRTRGPMSQPKAQPRRGGRTQQGTRSASTQRTKRGQGLAGP